MVYQPTSFVKTPNIARWQVETDYPREQEVNRVQSAKVLKVNPESHTADIVLCGGDERMIRNVPFLTPYSGTKNGMMRYPKVERVLDESDSEGPIDNPNPTKVEDTYVMICYGDGSADNAYIMGGHFPEVNHFTNKDIGYIDRHFTDDVELITNDGHRAKYTNDLSGTVTGWDDERDDPWHHDPGNGGPPDFDKKWKVEKTKDFYIASTQQSGKTRAKQWADGRYSVQQDNNTVMEFHTNGDISHETDGTHCMSAAVITLNAKDVHINGNLHVTDGVFATSVVAPQGTVPGPPADGGGSPPPPGPVVKHDVQKEWKA